MVTEPEREVDEREADLDEREAALDALEASLGRLDTQRAASRAEARQARDQARRLRIRATEARQVAARRRADARAVADEQWNEDYPLGAQFAGLAGQLMSAGDLHEALRHIVNTAVRVIPGVDLASVTTLSGAGRFRTPVRTDPLAARLDEAQYQAGEGPCLDATRRDGLGMARCDDLSAAEAPWPAFGPAAVRLGVRGVLAVGLFPQSSPPRLGALNLYTREPGALVDVDLDLAVVLAAHLAVALVALGQVDSAREQAFNLRIALDSRDVIGQAKGIIMARQHVSAEEAFDLLSAASQRLNIKLRDLAEQVIRSGGGEPGSRPMVT